MTQHLHAARVPGCYRCDLSQDEAAATGYRTGDPTPTSAFRSDGEVESPVRPHRHRGRPDAHNNPQRGSRLMPMTTRCQRGPHCTDPDLTPTGRIGAPTSRPLCDVCTTTTQHALHDTPNLYDRLRTAARTPNTSRPLTERVTGSNTHPMLLDGAAIHLCDTVHWLTTQWADTVLRTAGRPLPDRRSQPEADQLRDATQILLRYIVAWTVHGPAILPTDQGAHMTQTGWQAAHALITWKTHARRHLKLDRLIHRPPEPCPNCNTPRSLERHDGADRVTCRICHKSWTLAMYETFVHAWLGQQ